MCETRDNYISLNKMFYEWDEAIKGNNKKLAEANQGLSEDERQDANKVFIYGNLSDTRTALYTMASELDEFACPLTRALIKMCDDFALILEGGSAKDTYDYWMDFSIGETDTLLFKDDHCNFDGGYGGDIMNTGDFIVKNTDKEEKKLVEIEDCMRKLNKVSLNLSDPISEIREYGIKQKRVENLFSQLCIFGNKVEELNSSVRERFNEAIKPCYANSHQRTYTLDAFPDIDDVILLAAIVSSAGLDIEEVKAIAEKTGLSELEVAKMLSEMDDKNHKIIQNLLSGKNYYGWYWSTDEVSDDTLLIALLLGVDSLNPAEDGTVNQEFEDFLHGLTPELMIRMSKIGQDRLEETGETNTKLASVVGLINYLSKKVAYENNIGWDIPSLNYIDGIFTGTLNATFREPTTILNPLGFTKEFSISDGFTLGPYTPAKTISNMTDEEKTDFFRSTFIALLKAAEVDGRQSGSIQLDLGAFTLEFDYNLIAKANADGSEYAVNINDVIDNYTELMKHLTISDSGDGWQIEAGDGSAEVTSGFFNMQFGEDGTFAGITFTSEGDGTETTIKYDAGLGGTGLKFKVETDTSSDTYEFDTTYIISQKPGSPTVVTQPAYLPNPNPEPVYKLHFSKTEQPVLHYAELTGVAIIIIFVYMWRYGLI